MALALLVIALSVSPLALVLALLNRRDRRYQAVLNAIGPGLAMLDRHPGLAGSVAVRIDVGVGGPARVTLDMCACEARYLWPVMELFARLVPPGASVRVLRAPAAMGPRASILMEALGAS